MKFSFAHNNINVKDLDKSLAFYKEALLLEESRRLEDPSGAFTLVYLKSPYTAHELELTWLRDWDRPYKQIQMDIGQKSFRRGNINGIYVNPFRVVGWSQ